MAIRNIWIAVIILIATSCHKDVEDPNSETQTSEVVTVPYLYDEVNGHLLGYIYDNNGEPVPNAQVSTFNEETTTNEHGIYNFKDIGLDAQGTLIKINKEGYQPASDFIYPNENGFCLSKIRLIETSPNQTFQSASGGNIELSGNGQISFLPNSIAQLNGSSYNGSVSVIVRDFSSDIYNLNEEMQGGFIGKEESGKNVALAAIGFLDVSIMSADASLKLKPGSTFSLKFSIPTLYQSLAPESIKLWKFDDNTGHWIEGGMATKEGEYYIAEVNETGHWMLADIFELAQFCSRITTVSGDPAQNYSYRILVEGKVCGTGISSEEGFICAKLPKAQNLVLEVMHPFCNEVLDDIAIAPLSDVQNIGDIKLPIEEIYQNGIVECEGEPFSDAILLIKHGDATVLTLTEADGSFKLNVNSILCENGGDATLFAVNTLTSDASPTLTLTANVLPQLRLDVCKDECPLELGFRYEKTDLCIDGDYLVVTGEVAGGSGNYEFNWDDGGSGVSNSNIQTDMEKCLTVYDTETGCTISHCEPVPYYRTVTISEMEVFNPDCQTNSGYINIVVEGGRGPLTYLWTSTDGFVSSEKEIISLEPSIYSLVVTDIDGCTDLREVEVYDVTSDMIATTEDLCDYTIITIQETNGFEPYEYDWTGGGIANGNELVIYSPGTYSVKRIDANGCERNKDFNIGQVGQIDDLLPSQEYTCNGFEVLFQTVEPDVEYFFTPKGTSNTSEAEVVGGNIIIPILQSGYEFNLQAMHIQTGCIMEQDIILSNFSGLSVSEVINTSCTDCEDGQIIVDMDNGADCVDCEIGEVIILDKEDGANVTESNNAQELQAGEYYAVVLDMNTECYISFVEVIVE